MWFNIVYSQLVIQLIPGILRKSKLLSYLNVLVSEVNFLYYNLKNYRESLAYSTAFNGQVIYLEKILNDKFSISGQITITDENYTEFSYEFARNENIIDSYDYKYIENADNYFFKSNESVFNNFIINIPSATYSTLIANNNLLLNQLKWFVERYKITGSLFKIQTI